MKIIDKNLLKNTTIKYLQFLPDFKEEKTQKFTTLIFTLIALSFFGLFAITPTISTITELNKEIDDNKFVDQRLGQKINNLTILQQKYTTLQPDLPIILETIPKDPQVAIFAAQVQSVANTSNVIINSLQTFEVEVNNNTKQYSSFTFALTTEGTYNDLSNFLSNLSNMQRIAEVDILSLTKRAGASNSLELTLKGKTFFSQ